MPGVRMSVFAGNIWGRRGFIKGLSHFSPAKTLILRIFWLFAGAGLGGLPSLAPAQQVNSWISPVSGNWEDASWSLGSIPATNETILLTNSGFKAVQITANTAHNFPQSLNVNSVTISSPTDSFNTLLMNFSGLQIPLTVQSLSVGSNSAMTMLSSALQLNGPNGVGMTIGGQFNQSDSVVAGNQINVGYIGPGIYNFNSGFLNVSFLWVGGPFQGVFNQGGGTNGFGTTEIDGGDYILSNGYFAATIYFNNGGQFTQQGGLLNSDLTIFNGTYALQGGVHEGDTIVPSTDGFSSGAGGMLQGGGTNFGSMDVGSFGAGTYALTNGFSFGDNLSVDYAGTYNQAGGVQQVTNGISISEKQVAQNTFSAGSLNLNGGLLSCNEMSLGGFYTQSGGTNHISGDIVTEGIQPALSISGGLLAANNITASPGFTGGVFLSGGTLVVSNQLLIEGNSSFPAWQGFAGSGGTLVVSGITLAPASRFSCGTSVIVQSGALTMTNAILYAGQAVTQFGPLQLATGGASNSILAMPSAVASTLRFADSSGLAWSSGAVLTVSNWSGSLAGSGAQQTIFGTGPTGLTAQQLGQIQFQNPAGLAPGNYPAKILFNGEIVPDAGAGIAAQMRLQREVNGMQVTLQGQAGRNYAIETSTNLVNWEQLTTASNSSGTVTILDTNSVNIPVRFYRAKLMP